MKKLKDISLELDYEENLHNNAKYSSDFAFYCRFIGNYLTRQVKKSSFEPSGYNRLFISACQFVIAPNKILDNVLRVFVTFDKIKYESLSKLDLPAFFIEMYRAGIIKASQTHEIPVEFLLTQLDEFQANNYLNEWEFKTRSFKNIGLKAKLLCKMTMDFFSLSLILTKGNETVFREEVLRTLPDETIYHWRFKDIVLEGDEIKILDHNQEPIYSLDLTFKV